MMIPVLKNQKPIYKQIIRHFEELIINGELPPLTLLPTERELASQLNVNRSTVNTAYDELRASGLIQSVQGSGTRVSDNLWDISPHRILNWNNFKNFSFAPTLPIVKKIEEARLDPAIINLANGELSEDLYPVEKFNAILGNMAASHADYFGAYDDTVFKNLLSIHLQKQKIWVDPAEMLVIPSIQQAILLITHCLLNPGDTIAIECPSYTYTVKLFSSAGVRMVRLPVNEEGMNPEEVRSLYKKHKIKMVVTEPTYHNPTGSVLNLERRKRLIDICTELEILIVEVDCTRPLSHGKTDLPPSLYSLGNGNRQVIHIGSFSDTIAPGIPVTWLLTPPGFVSKFSDAKYQMGLGTSNLYLQLVSELITNGWNENILHIISVLENRKKCMVECLNHYLRDQFTFTIPEGGLYLWGKLEAHTRDKDLLDAGIKEKVLITPGSVYGAPDGFVRLAFSKVNEDNIELGVKRLAQAVQHTKITQIPIRTN